MIKKWKDIDQTSKFQTTESAVLLLVCLVP